MVPKRDRGIGYASKPGILLCRSVAMKQGKKPATGQFMVQTRGQELKQITEIGMKLKQCTQKNLILVSKFIDLLLEEQEEE